MKTMGVYEIKNNSNGKVYIGGTINIERRWSMHKSNLNANRHCNKELQKDWEIFGEETFSLRVVEPIAQECDLGAREKHYINRALKDSECYNIIRSSIGLRNSKNARDKNGYPDYTRAARTNRREEFLNEAAQRMGEESWSKLSTKFRGAIETSKSDTEKDEQLKILLNKLLENLSQ